MTSPSRPSAFEDRYRLYLDESGDHVYRETADTAHPAKLWVLRHFSLLDNAPAPFADRLMNVVEEKFNRHLYNNRIDGYGFVLYPKR
jgi:hypothetical protein